MKTLSLPLGRERFASQGRRRDRWGVRSYQQIGRTGLRVVQRKQRKRDNGGYLLETRRRGWWKQSEEDNDDDNDEDDEEDEEDYRPASLCQPEKTGTRSTLELPSRQHVVGYIRCLN
ncbi:hypothetical protein PUN28_010086 [Cardiocondyla obscurior]|uniref:Uncharacterized protein n=1 Tax=Cardiocondyla obscurior TaxID=286306 RepID=A0AAW2FS07_9HYME